MANRMNLRVSAHDPQEDRGSAVTTANNEDRRSFLMGRSERNRAREKCHDASSAEPKTCLHDSIIGVRRHGAVSVAGLGFDLRQFEDWENIVPVLPAMLCDVEEIAADCPGDFQTGRAQMTRAQP